MSALERARENLRRACEDGERLYRLRMHDEPTIADDNRINGILTLDLPDALGIVDALVAAVARLEQERDEWAKTALNRADSLAAARAREQRAVDALRAIHTVAINGTICTPPDTWQDPFMGGDGTGLMFDVGALKCGECRSAWRKVVAALAAEPAADERPGYWPNNETGGAQTTPLPAGSGVAGSASAAADEPGER